MGICYWFCCTFRKGAYDTGPLECTDGSREALFVYETFECPEKAMLYDTYSFPSEPHREFCHPVDQLMDRDLTIARTILTFFLPLFIIFIAYAGEFWTIDTERLV